jgi:RNA polymerase sigma factor (sigma-70 family)
MCSMDDMELLREYVTKGSEAAFETVVTRHVNLVYSAAFRQVRDATVAEEVTQTVFIILARKAGALREGTILSGWLYRTARFAGSRALRTELRRRNHEQEAAQMKPEQADPAWEQIAPLLEEGMAGLGKGDHNAVVLRYFENKSLKEVGAAFGSNERAAQKRVARAVEKLRAFFTKRGMILSVAVITTALSANAIQVAPAEMASLAAAGALKGGAATGSIAVLTKATLRLMAWLKVKTAALICVTVLAAVGTAGVAVKEVERLNGPVPDPVYEGKRLSAWLDGYCDMTKHPSYSPERRQADDAIRHIGTNGIPLLLWMIGATDADLLHNLGDPGEKRQDAEFAFQTLGATAKDAVPELITIYKHGVSEISQSATAGALGNIGPPSEPAVPLLLVAAENPKVFIRESALFALGRIHAQPVLAVPVLIKHLRDSDAGSRMVSATSLGFFDGQARQAIPALIDTLHDTEWYVRPPAARALGRIHAEPEVVVPALTRSLHDSYVEAQKLSIEALGAFGADASPAIPTLVELLTDTNDQVRSMAAGELGQLHDASDLVVPPLAKMLDDSSPWVRLSAASALGDLRVETKPAAAVLVKLLGDTNEVLREYAGQALKKISPEAAAKAGVK